MSEKDYDKKAVEEIEVEGKKRKIEWKLKGKTLTSTTRFFRHGVTIERAFNFATGKVTRKCHYSKNPTGNGDYTKDFDEMREKCPKLYIRALNQYIKFHHT